MQTSYKQESYMTYMVSIKIYIGFKFLYVCKAHYPKPLFTIYDEIDRKDTIFYKNKCFFIKNK